MKREVRQLLKLTEQAYTADISDGMSTPEELERREAPLAAIAKAKQTIEARMQERKQFAPAPKAAPASATPIQKLVHRLKTPKNKALYALRKQTPEPVLGIIKSVMGSTSSCCAASTTSKVNGTSWP